MGKFVIRKNKSGYSYYFEGENALILGSSDRHKTMGSAKIGIESVKSIAGQCSTEDRTDEGAKKLRNPKFEIYMDGNRKLRFRMKAKNGQQVLTSVPFKEKEDLMGAIDVIKTTAADSAVSTQY